VIGSVAIAERCSEIDALCGDGLLIAVLPVEGEEVFDAPNVGGFVQVSRGIFDVVQLELVSTSGGDGCACVGAGSLKALITV
jgi:hypothetical protein